MKTIDINQVDKKHFKCYKFDDESVYYGEIGYLDEFNNLVTEVEKYNDEMLKHLKLVRHGKGVALYGVTETNSFSSRYEGNWSKDKKTGQGICYYPDKSVYEGNFVNNLFDGYGIFTWPNNDTYTGEWRNGKMEGEGEFKHTDGHCLKGKFTNNYYLDVLIFIFVILKYKTYFLFKFISFLVFIFKNNQMKYRKKDL